MVVYHDLTPTFVVICTYMTTCSQHILQFGGTDFVSCGYINGDQFTKPKDTDTDIFDTFGYSEAK